VTTTTQESLVKMLIAGRIDVFVLPRESLAWRVQQLGVRYQIKALELDLWTSEYYVTVSKKSAVVTDAGVFLARMDACLREAKADGRYAAVLAKYGIEETEVEVDAGS
jgi:ABC-type amino acid transport substrate-binding protein